jgi:aminoglycoside/choline kinase family phosphotransferase
MSTADARLQLLRDWLTVGLRWPLARLEPASADASFRRYFRVWRDDGATRVVMDAPPDKEDIRPYLKVSRLLERCGVHVPHIDAVDEVRGLILLEDLGSEQLLACLNAGGDADALYGDALDALARIQRASAPLLRELPPYDRAALEREMRLLPEWFCARHLQLAPDAARDALLAQTMDLLVREMLAQPVVLVHRDYHSRNLMVLPERGPGILDFQDALAGPIAYDLVSLLKDCYIAWPRARVERWVLAYLASIRDTGLVDDVDDAQFLRWFDMAGLQRHLKVLGIFARLWYRDGKSGYLADLPLTLEYVRDTARRYGELQAFSAWVEAVLVPGLAPANAREAQRIAAGAAS